jgi:ABC-type metal ion transport system substrate-binding protein
MTDAAKCKPTLFIVLICAALLAGCGKSATVAVADKVNKETAATAEQKETEVKEPEAKEPEAKEEVPKGVPNLLLFREKAYEWREDKPAIKQHFTYLMLDGESKTDIENLEDEATMLLVKRVALLEANGLIRLEEGVGLQATVLSIEENPYNIEILEMEAAQTPRVIDEVDFAVVNGNYAIDADIRDRLLANEDAASDAALTYANLIVVKAGEEESLKTKALTAAIISDDIRTFINETYDGAVVAVF